MYLARIIQFGGFYRNASKVVKSRNLTFIIARLLWLKLPLSLVKSPKLHFFESVQIRRLIDVFATLLLDYFFAINKCILYFRHSSLGPAFFETFKATDVRLKKTFMNEKKSSSNLLKIFPLRGPPATGLFMIHCNQSGSWRFSNF